MSPRQLYSTTGTVILLGSGRTRSCCARGREPPRRGWIRRSSVDDLNPPKILFVTSSTALFLSGMDTLRKKLLIVYRTTKGAVTLPAI